MKFISLKVSGFGSIVEREFEFSPGVTLVTGPNEAGKSTLQRCMLAMLYGLERQPVRKGGTTWPSEWEVFKPWDETAHYAASAKLVMKSGQEVSIAKEFGTERTNAQVMAGGKDIGREIPPDKTTKDLKIGEHLFGLSREEFEASALVRQYQVRWEEGKAEALRSKVEALVDSAGKESAAAAAEILEETIREKIGTDRSPTKPLNVCRKAIEEKKASLDKAEGALAEVMETSKEIDGLEAELGRVEADAKKFALLGRYGELLSNKKALDARREAENRVEALRTNLAGMEPPAPPTVDHGELDRRRQELRGKEGELKALEGQREAAAAGVSASLREIRERSRALWQALVEVEILEGEPRDAPADDLNKAEQWMDEIGETIQKGIERKEERQELWRKRIRKEQFARVGGALAGIGGMIAIGLGLHDGRTPLIVAGAILLALGIVLLSVLALRKRYEAVPLKPPDIAAMRQDFSAIRDTVAGTKRQAENLRGLLAAEQNVRKAVGTESDELAALLKAAGAKGNSLAALEADYKQVQERRDTYASLTSKLDDAVGRRDELASEGSVAELESKLKELEKAVTLTPELEAEFKSSEDYAQRERSAGAEELRLAADVRGLRVRRESRLASVEPPAQLRAELEGLRAEEAKLEQFKRALEIAKEVLAKVAEGVHARWSKPLNEVTSELLEELTSGRYSEVTFGDDLSPAVKRPDGRFILQGPRLERHLSEGTKDLLYLAARVAVAKELSSAGEPLPLILDDPLVALDESRLRRTLSLLTKMARRIQVIVFTCQAGHEETLARQCSQEGVAFSSINLP